MNEHKIIFDHIIIKVRNAHNEVKQMKMRTRCPLSNTILLNIDIQFNIHI